jgi:glycosyltransferase involved in cell wall biosynthesis
MPARSKEYGECAGSTVLGARRTFHITEHLPTPATMRLIHQPPNAAIETNVMSAVDRAPTVSVVVPCYNGGPFIDQLLGSLAAQTFRDFEIIIVDDGSTDPTTIGKLDSLPTAVRVIRQQNLGLPGARNTGFRAARADLVLPLDCDDTIEPTYLAETVRSLGAAPADVAFVVTYVRFVGARSGIGECYFNPFDLLFSNQLVCCMLMRKAAWQAVGSYDETMRDGYEDWEFAIRLSRHGYRGIAIEKPLFNYRISETGMMMTRSSRMHGALWRQIRRRHAESYRLPEVLRLWWRAGRSGKIGLPVSLGLLATASVLPEAWFNSLIHRIRQMRIARQMRGAEAVRPAPTALLPIRGGPK